MIDSIEAFSNIIYVPDESFKRDKNGWLKKVGFRFKILNNGRLLISGELSKFWNIINNISDTNYPLIPLNSLNLALQTFEDFFNIRLNDIDLTRLDIAYDLNYDIYFDLNNLDILSKQYDVKTFSKFDTSVIFSQKKEGNLRLVFYQNLAKNRPAGVRFETRFLKSSVPYKHLSQVTEDKIKSIIIPSMVYQLESVVYKSEGPELITDLSKFTYTDLKNAFYRYGLLVFSNINYHQFVAHCKANGADRHALRRLDLERNEILKKSSGLVIQDPIKLILNNLNTIKNGL